MTVKEKYWSYSLIVIILGLGVILFIKFFPFIGGILGAATIYVMVRGHMNSLTQKRRWNRSLAAAVITTEVVLCFLIPFCLFFWMIYSELRGIDFDPDHIVPAVQSLSDTIYQKVGYHLYENGGLNISSLSAFIPTIGKAIMSSMSRFFIDIFVLLFFLYFMLLEGPKMEKYITDLLPFNDANKKEMLHKFRMLVKSNTLGIPILAIIQGGIALIGYIIFGVPNPLLFGFLTCFATLIPVVGTALIWVPLVVYLVLAGNLGAAIGLTLYALIVIISFDHCIRFVLQKKMVNTHPLITVFGVFIGLSLFGFMGIIFGPILLAMFLLCVDMFKKEYLDDK